MGVPPCPRLDGVPPCPDLGWGVTLGTPCQQNGVPPIQMRYRWGGTPSQVQMGSTPSQVWMGVPYPTYPRSGRESPFQDQDGGYPLSKTGWVPPVQTWDRGYPGYPPVSRMQRAVCLLSSRRRTFWFFQKKHKLNLRKLLATHMFVSDYLFVLME